jgi:hypothetical protein
MPKAADHPVVLVVFLQLDHKGITFERTFVVPWNAFCPHKRPPRKTKCVVFPRTFLPDMDDMNIDYIKGYERHSFFSLFEACCKVKSDGQRQLPAALLEAAVVHLGGHALDSCDLESFSTTSQECGRVCGKATLIFQ